MAGRERGRGAPVTMAVVARRAGVSPQTVSNAFNSPELLRPETLERVRRAVRELNYRPHRAARSLRTRTSRLIGYAVRPADGEGGALMDRFLHALTRSADGAGYRVLLLPSAGGPEETEGYEELLREHSVDAFVLTHTERGDRRQAWLRRRGVPFVAFGRSWGPEGAGDWVDVDGAEGTAQAVDHLVGLGHRRIAFLGWPSGSGAGDDRRRGWREAVRRHGLPARGLRAEAPGGAEEGASATGALLDAGATAVVAVCDALAVGSYLALRDRGLAAGRDVSVVGFDDSPAARVLSPGLTTLAQPLEEVGRQCVRLLLRRIGDPGAPPGRVLLPPRLVVRGSTAPTARRGGRRGPVSGSARPTACGR